LVKNVRPAGSIAASPGRAPGLHASAGPEGEDRRARI